MVGAHPARREERARAGRRPGGRRAPRLRHRRRAGGGGAGLGHGDDPARGQDHRPRQRLCRQRQAACLRPGRHRHDRRPERDPGAGRRQHPRRLGGDGPLQPGRARRTGAEHPAQPRRGLHRRRAGGHRSPAARHAAPRRHPRLARRPRRADPHAQHGRGVRDQQPHRARAPGSELARPAALGAAAAPRRRDLPGRLHQREPGRLLRRPQPRAAHFGHGALLVAAGRLRLRQAQQPDRGQRRRGPGAGPDRGGAGAWRGPAGACPGGRDAPRGGCRDSRRGGGCRPHRPHHPPGREVDARLCDPAQRRPGEARCDGKPLPPAARAAAGTG